jgi:hypothetical protein
MMEWNELLSLPVRWQHASAGASMRLAARVGTTGCVLVGHVYGFLVLRSSRRDVDER